MSINANKGVINSLHLAVISALMFSTASVVCAAQESTLFSRAVAMANSDAGQPMVQVQLDLNALKSVKPGQSLKLDFPGMGKHQIVYDGSLGNKWMGHLKEGLEFSVVLDIGDGISGQILAPEGRFRLGQVNGEQWLVREGMDQSALLATLPAMFRQTMTVAPAVAAKKPANVAYPVSFDLVAMSQLKAGEEVALTIPGQGAHRIVYEETRATDSGNTIWVGYLKDYGNDFRVVVTSGPEGSVGNVFTPGGEYELTLEGSQQWLVDRNASKLTTLVPDHSDALHVATTLLNSKAGQIPGLPQTGAQLVTNTVTTTTVSNGITITSTSTTSYNDTVDLLVLTTPGFQTKRGSSWRLRIDQLVAIANQAYIDSGVNSRVRLVGVEIINTSDTTSNSTTLTALANGAAPFSNVANLRNTYGADLVTLLRPFYNTAQGRNCGVGYILGSASNAISLYSPYAFSVVSDGVDNAGTNTYCTDFTLAHEMGHNMGSMHDRATVIAQGGTATSQGAYNYGFGYGISGTFGTIMSYINPRIGKFSNPNDSTCGGKYVCGVSEVNNTTTSANNAKSLNNTMPLVANFRSTMVPETPTISGVVSKAGVAVSGVTITPSTTGVSCNATGSTGAYSCTVPNNWSGTLTPSLSGATFSPGSLSFTAVTNKLVNQNFTKN